MIPDPETRQKASTAWEFDESDYFLLLMLVALTRLRLSMIWQIENLREAFFYHGILNLCLGFL